MCVCVCVWVWVGGCVGVCVCVRACVWVCVCVIKMSTALLLYADLCASVNGSYFYHSRPHRMHLMM